LARHLSVAGSRRRRDGTNDLVVSQVVRVNELESWFIGKQLASQRSS
jgi:starvation-inducible DNA-binding protein